MIPVRLFEYYLEKAIIRKVQPDIEKSKSLVEMAKNRKKVLEEVIKTQKITNLNSFLIIENSYDILMELIRSILIKKGFKASGEGAHVAEISYLKNLNFLDEEIQFMNELRNNRNQIKYYGKSFDFEYAKKVILFLPKLYELLKEKSKK